MFFIWLYLDFSAYSDIAVGIGKLLGVQTPENFNRPYFARNIIVFWERWHISLSLWIRRNLFFPIQVALLRRTGGDYQMLCGAIGFAVSFLLCGLWHGIAWNFVVWGVMHATGLIAVNAYRKRLSERLGAKGLKAYLANPYIKALEHVHHVRVGGLLPSDVLLSLLGGFGMSIRHWFVSRELNAWQYALRLAIVVAEVLLAYCFAGQNSPFFYQAF